MDYDAEFTNITKRLGDIANPELAIDLLSISQVVERLNEAALFLGKFVSMVIATPKGEGVEFPDELLPILPRLAALAEETADLIHETVCDECEGCDCDDPECKGCDLDD